MEEEIDEQTKRTEAVYSSETLLVMYEVRMSIFIRL
jgi:hypothetical protein